MKPNLPLAVGLLFLSACSRGPVPDEAATPRLTLEPYVVESNDGEEVQAELGRFLVPENRRSPSGKQIELAFVRFKSTNPDPGPPIVYLAGGPGGSGIDAAGGSRFPLFMAFREVADVIAFDQRATGLSSPIEEEECETTRPVPLDRPLDHDTLIALSVDATRECGGFWRSHGVDLSAYNTMESAHDLEALRRVLGADRLSLWAISYGTHLALATIRRYPDRIHRAILAGVEGPDHTVKLPGYSQRQIDALVRLIEDDPEASRLYPDVKGTMQQVLDRLEQQPVTIEFLPADGGQPARLMVGRPELERATVRMLRDPSTLVAVPSFYERLAGGDYFPLSRGLEASFEMEAMSEAMDAASGMSEERRRRFLREDESTLLGGVDQLGNAMTAEALGVPLLPDEFRSPVRSEIPALFISGTLDGRTPVGNAEEVLEGFPNGVHLVIENAGHSDPLFLSSPRIKDVMLAFMNGDAVDTKRIRVPPPDFDSVRTGILQSPAVARRYLGQYTREKTGDVWTVIHTGTTRLLDSNGNVANEGMSIQFRVADNGFTLTPISETTYFVPLPGMEQIDFVFRLNDRGEVVSLDFTNSSGEIESLPRMKSGEL